MDFIHERPNNMRVPMTRRYPNLKQKQLQRDAKIASKLIELWDIHNDQHEVFRYFLSNRHKLSPERYWELLRTVWILCGSVERSPVFVDLFIADKRSQHYLMTPEEHQALRDLPDEMDVYRATNLKGDAGLSWTYNLDYAKKYQRMFNKTYLLTERIEKFEIFALFNRNLEYELILL